MYDYNVYITWTLITWRLHTGVWLYYNIVYGSWSEQECMSMWEQYTVAVHKPSNSTGFGQYWGNLANIACFSSLSSRIGSQGCSRQPITVQWRNTSSPKNASRASLVASVGALLTTTNLWYFAKAWVGDISESFLIEVDDRIFAFFLGLMGLHFASLSDRCCSGDESWNGWWGVWWSSDGVGLVWGML